MLRPNLGLARLRNAEREKHRWPAGRCAVRLPVHLVEHLQRVIGGDARVEKMVRRYIADRHQAQELWQLPPAVALEIVKRPGDFIRDAKQYCEPELSFRTGTEAEGNQFFNRK